MKNFSSLIILVICFHFAKATDEVPNSGFETWTSGNPTSWYTSNIPSYGIPITQAGGHTGTYSAKGEAVIATGGDTLPPVLITGTPGAFFPISQNYSTLEFYYQTNLAAGDILDATVIIVDGSNAIIGGTDEIFTGTTSGWAHATVTIPYSGNDIAAGASIQFVIQTDGNSTDRAYPLLSSYMMIDDVALTGLVGVKTISRVPNLQVYPVPTRDHLTIKGQTDQNKALHLLLTDACGRLVMERNYGASKDSFIQDELNLQGIAPGLYSLAIISDDKTQVRRIIVQ